VREQQGASVEGGVPEVGMTSGLLCGRSLKSSLAALG